MKEISLSARRYATAFFKETYNSVGDKFVLNDLELFNAVVSSNSTFVKYLLNDYLDSKRKIELLRKNFFEKFNNKTKSLFEFLYFKQRLNLLPGIVECYLLLYEKEQKIRKLTIYLSEKNEKIESSILEILKDKMKCSFNLSMIYDNSLIGGFKYKIDDLVYDCSISGKLRNLRKIFLTGLLN